MSETEREVEQYLREQVFGGGAKSPAEAAAQEPDPERAAPRRHQIELPGDPVQPVPAEDAPVVVPDEPSRPAEPFPPSEADLPEPTPESEEEPEEEDLGEGEHIVWAKKKYGDDPDKWAKAARDQELHITRLANEKREAEELAGQWYEYAQQAEAQQQSFGAAMPLSAGEEQWVEASLSNPIEYARQAAFQGKTQLYNGVIGRIAEENPMLAAQIGTQVQTELQQYAAYEAQQNGAAQQPNLAEQLGGSFARLGIDLQTEGPRLAQKIGELGEYNPYVQAILTGDDGQRDLAVQAVYDLSHTTTTTRRQSRDANIQRENELRRDAAVVQSGGIQAPAPPPKRPALFEGMEEEWRRRGQWADDE